MKEEYSKKSARRKYLNLNAEDENNLNPNIYMNSYSSN